MHDETKYLAGPTADSTGFASLTTPIHRASTIVFPGLKAFEERSRQIYDGYAYGLYGTPTTRTLEQRVADLEGGARAIVVPSGMAAISLVSLAFARPGQRVLMPDSMYGPARDMATRFLTAFGVETVFYDPRGSAEGQITDGAALAWVESPGSLTFEVQDARAIARVAHAAGALVAADNTWATPLLFKPLDHGCDFAMQALSKYASGHGDVVLGSVAVRDEAYYRKLKDTARFLGYGVSGDDCALCLRGLATLPIRLRHSEASAIKLMSWLESRPSVATILHPSRKTQPGHIFWQRDFAGSAGVFSVIVKPAPRQILEAAFGALRLFRIGASWGGINSLLAPSDPRKGRTSVDWLPDGQLVRVSVGLEHVDDLIADLERFLAVIDGANRSVAENRHVAN